MSDKLLLNGNSMFNRGPFIVSVLVLQISKILNNKARGKPNSVNFPRFRIFATTLFLL